MILLAKSKLHANLLVTSDILKSVQKKKNKTKTKNQACGFLHNVLHTHGCLQTSEAFHSTEGTDLWPPLSMNANTTNSDRPLQEDQAAKCSGC